MKWLFCLILIFNLTTSGYPQKSLVDSIKMASVYENEKELGEILRKAGIGLKTKENMIVPKNAIQPHYLFQKH